MMAFSKSIRKADRIRRYIIQTTDAGWEVREEQDREVVRQAWYQDWHRVERARRAFVISMTSLRNEGWTETD
ncbi:MAG: hypothetical protein H0T71_09365 [Acidobacteria bacterium]|nr:hypothetical protein [Acidobacteriota bacterium]